MCSLSPPRSFPKTAGAAVLRGGAQRAEPPEGVGAPSTSVGLARAAIGHYRRAAAALGSLEGDQDEGSSSLLRLHSRVGGCLEKLHTTRSARAVFSLWRVHARSTPRAALRARGTGRVHGGSGGGEGMAGGQQDMLKGHLPRVAGGEQDMLVAELKDQLRRAIAVRERVLY